MELAEQTALITGGTAGIGLACAELLAREGASVISTGRDEQRGKSAAAGIDGRVRFVQADLSDIESVESLIRTWAAEFGARGVRVNSVAPGPAKTEGVEAEWGEGNEELGRALPLGRTAEPEEITHAVLFLASPGQASSPVQPCTPMAAAAPSETHEEERPMSKKYDAQWENALTVVQEVSPPFIPEGAQAMTVVIDYPPGSAGAPPHRHPSGPAFGYMLEGEMLFELEGSPPRVIRAGEAFWEPGGDVIHYSDGNNREDMRCRFTVTMLCVPGRPMLTLVDDDELAARKHLRVPAESGTAESLEKA